MTITTLIRPIAQAAIQDMPLGWLSGTVILVKDGNVIMGLSPYNWVCKADSISSTVSRFSGSRS